MLLCPCRFNVPLTDNKGQPIDPHVIVELHGELLARFGGFTIHPKSHGRWQSREGRLYQEEVVVYEVAVRAEHIPILRGVVCGLGQRLGQVAMYFDAPPPSVEVIDLTDLLSKPASPGGSRHEPRKSKTTRRRSKRNRPAG